MKKHCTGIMDALETSSRRELYTSDVLSRGWLVTVTCSMGTLYMDISGVALV